MAAVLYFFKGGKKEKEFEQIDTLFEYLCKIESKTHHFLSFLIFSAFVSTKAVEN